MVLIFSFSTVFGQSSMELLTGGLASLKMERYDESVEIFTQYLESSKEKIPGYLGRAEAYMELKNYENAISDFKAADQLSPGKGSIGLARVYARMGNAALSVQNLEKHLKSDSRIPEKEILLDKSFESVENSREWRTLWRNDWYTEEEHFVREIEYLIGNESYKEARIQLDEKIGEDPENAALYHLRAKVSLEQDEFRDALSDSEMALRYGKDELDYLVTRSSILREMKKYGEAVKSMNRAIYLYPERLDLLMVRSEIHQLSGDLSRALDDIEKYIGYIDNDKAALLLCGLLNQESGKLYPALECFNKLIELDQGNAQYFNARGNAYFVSGTYRYAIADFGMALDLDPSNEMTYLNRGKSYLAVDDKERACYDFRQAAEKGNKEASELFYTYCKD
jgi:tetratricopeptide (TPR) repeat protein